MDILWAGTFVPEFERNKRLGEYLAESRASVRQVRQRLWPEDRVAAFAESRVKVVGRMTYVYPVLFLRLVIARRPDVYIVSYPGWFDVPVVKLVAWLKRRPVVFDVFISLYDTAISDRQLAAIGSRVARIARWIDRVSMRMSDRIISDTRTHADFLAALSGIPSERFGVLYLGADESVFRPIAVEPNPNTVLFYGTFVPLQGADVIVQAAQQLSDTGVRIRFIGAGQTLNETLSLADELGVRNVDFLGRMPQWELKNELARAALCLGIFGKTAKASRVVPHKVYEALAAGRPVLTGRTEAIEEVFHENEVLSVAPADPGKLADAIRSAIEDQDGLREAARAGRARFLRDFARKPQSERLIQELARVVSS
jgi:glycosyltransferase involved in cell wall biosynthesis